MSEEKRWTPARAAVAQIKASFGGDDWAAQSVIAKRLRDGVLTACADRIVSDRFGEASELAGEPVQVPDWVWTKSQRWQEDQQGWLWLTGDFTVSNGDEFMGQKYRLFGLHFDADQIDQLAPPGASVQAVQSDRKGVGGAPKKTEAWDAFWFAVVAIARDQRLTTSQFRSQVELREELLLSINNTLSDDSIKPVVSQIWRKFVDSSR